MKLTFFLLFKNIINIFVNILLFIYEKMLLTIFYDEIFNIYTNKFLFYYMEDLRNIDEQFKDLIKKRKQKDIKICYNNIEEINFLINKLNQMNHPFLNERKNKLIDIYENEIYMNIMYIIYLSYSYFMNNIDTENDYKSVFVNIQNSSFYNQYKSNIKIQTMELYFLMDELNINNNYYNTLEKLRELIEDVYDLELKNEINEFIKYCEIGYLNNEKNEIKKLLNKKEFDKAKIKYEKILNEFKSDCVVKNVKKEYNCLLKNINNLNS